MDGVADKKRFKVTAKESKMGISGTRIIVDKDTGVQYLFAFDGYAGGMTALLDRNGKPLLAKNYRDE